VAADPTALEQGANTAAFVVSLDVATPSPLTVRYSASTGGPGRATRGTDYTLKPLPSRRVTIPANQAAALITLTPKDDAAAEGTETATLTLIPKANYLLHPTLKSATAVILDNEPVVSIVATDPNAAEAGSDTAIFTVTRSVVSASPLTVHYTTNPGGKGRAGLGSDYALRPTPAGRVTIPGGQPSVTVKLTPMDDRRLAEGPEIATLTLSPSAPYSIDPLKKRAVATIADND
jgi:hypothetical protein